MISFALLYGYVCTLYAMIREVRISFKGVFKACVCVHAFVKACVVGVCAYVPACVCICAYAQLRRNGIDPRSLII